MEIGFVTYPHQYKPKMEAEKGVTNHYILRTLKNGLLASKLFIGVYSSDTVNSKQIKDTSEFILVCNLSPRAAPGSHFVTIIGVKGELIYVDSLAQPAQLSARLYSTLKSTGKKITTLLHRPIQAFSSQFCGIFCIYYSMFFDYKRFPIIKNQKSFLKNDLYKNDGICLHNIKSIIKANPV